MNRYEIIVGNVGRVYQGDDHPEAAREYEAYVASSKEGHGRDAHEPVTLMCNGEPVKEHPGGVYTRVSVYFTLEMYTEVGEDFEKARLEAEEAIRRAVCDGLRLTDPHHPRVRLTRLSGAGGQP